MYLCRTTGKVLMFVLQKDHEKCALCLLVLLFSPSKKSKENPLRYMHEICEVSFPFFLMHFSALIAIILKLRIAFSY